MSTQNIGFSGEIKKKTILHLFEKKIPGPSCSKHR